MDSSPSTPPRTRSTRRTPGAPRASTVRTGHIYIPLVRYKWDAATKKDRGAERCQNFFGRRATDKMRVVRQAGIGASLISAAGHHARLLLDAIQNGRKPAESSLRYMSFYFDVVEPFDSSYSLQEYDRRGDVDYHSGIVRNLRYVALETVPDCYGVPMGRTVVTTDIYDAVYRPPVHQPNEDAVVGVLRLNERHASENHMLESYIHGFDREQAASIYSHDDVVTRGLQTFESIEAAENS